MARRVLSRDTLEELLVRERSESIPLVRLLELEGVVSTQDLLAALASELGVPFVDLADLSIPPDVWALVPEDLAREHLAVAVERRANGVLVALADPSVEDVLARIEGAIGSAVIPAIAGHDELAGFVAQMYPAAGAAAPPAAGPPPVQLESLLDEVLRAGASDLHLTVGAPPVVRVLGQLVRMPGRPVLNGSDVRRLIFGVLTARQRERLLSEGELSTSHAIPGKGRFRVSVFIQRDSVAAVLRLVPGEIPSTEDLGMPEQCIGWVEQRRGLVLVCGPQGSGTSTSVASLVDHINRTRACHVLTVEHPIEFLHRHDQAIVNQREVGEDTASVEAGLRSALSQDPDVLVAGELPTVECLRLALAAAETGQLVIATIRTVDAVQTIERIVDVFPPDQQRQVRVQLANTLRGLMVQQLVPALDGGLALAAEVVLPTPPVLESIRAGDSANLTKAILGGVTSGMTTMDQSLADLVRAGIISAEAAVDHAVEPAEVRYLLSGTRR